MKRIQVLLVIVLFIKYIGITYSRVEVLRDFQKIWRLKIRTQIGGLGVQPTEKKIPTFGLS
jgi:hypothetical protein